MNLKSLFNEGIYQGVTKEYFKAVVAAKAGSINKRFLNDSLSHAKLLADLMIGEASTDDDVRIYSGALSRECYDEALRSSKAKSIHILVDDANAAQINLKKIRKDIDSNICVRVYDQKTHYPHFFVAGNSFRLELSCEDATAVANFNDQSEVRDKLTDTFDLLWKTATPLFKGVATVFTGDIV